MPTAGPVTASERISTLDTLRGFALFVLPEGQLRSRSKFIKSDFP